MGLLTQLISSEFEKKKEERQFQLRAYYDALASGKVKPGQEKMAWDLLKKQAPKDSHGLIDNVIKPITMLRSRKRGVDGKESIGQTEHRPTIKSGEADTSIGADEMGAPASVGYSPSTSPQKDYPFYTQEEEDERAVRLARQKNDLDIEKAQREYADKTRLNLAADIAERKQLNKEYQETVNDPNLSEGDKQWRIDQLSKNGSSLGKPIIGAVVSPDGHTTKPAMTNPRKPGTFVDYEGKEFQFTGPMQGWSFKSQADLDRESKPPNEAAQKDAEIFGAYKERHGIQDRELTASEKLTARSEAAVATESPEVKAQREATLEATKERIEATRERIAKEREERSSVPKDIQPGTREYRVAQDLAYGRLTMQEFRSLTAYSRDTNKKMDIYDKAAQLNPAFNAAQFEMGFKLASNPRVQQQLASLDNVKMGVDDLLKASDAATRTGSTLLNRAVIPGGIAIGNKKYSNFATARTAFADELSGALGYGSATDMSREMGFNMTNAALSPEAFRSGIQDIVIPFVERKKKSLLDQMGVYGQPGMNPAAGAPSSSGGAKRKVWNDQLQKFEDK